MTASAAETRPKPTGLFAQLSRFGLSGCLSAIVDFGSVLLFVAIGLGPQLARALGFILGSAMAYLLNRVWTFESRRSTREVAVVATIYTLTFGLVLVINAISLHFLPVAWWTVSAAWVLSQSVGTTFNFLTQRFLVFRR